ncbi:hypothetical protein A943_20930 [Bacillus sp. CPSM8]|nr:hypothetical protein A943_20930 [Bacillus sp. CPSM8]
MAITPFTFSLHEIKGDNQNFHMISAHYLV